MILEGRVLIYSITGCPHCMRAKNTLQEFEIPYTDVNLDRFPQCRQYVRDMTGKTSVPQIFFNEKYIGGNSDLQDLVLNYNAWTELVEYVESTPVPDGAPEPPDPSTAVSTGIASDFQCEPDEYAALVIELKGSGIIKDHRSGLTSHSKSFRGSDFVDWAVRTKGFDRAKAVELGQMLVESHFGRGTQATQTEFKDSPSDFYRLLEDDDSHALNSGSVSSCKPMAASDVGESLRRLILKIYTSFLSKDGKKVNYAGIGGSEEFNNVYMKLARELVRVKIEDEPREVKVAFFINIYNALVIHANIAHGPPTNLWQRYKFFNTNFYIIGGQRYSLQDIENGVLRANRKGVGQFSKPFSAGDPRLAVALTECELRVHFALVCGAKSCPPIKTYSADGIDEQLALAAEAFLETDEAMVLVPHKNKVKLSQIFKWYKEDFGRSDMEVLSTLWKLMGPGTKRDTLKEMLSSNSVIVKHMTYDWNVNSS